MARALPLPDGCVMQAQRYRHRISFEEQTTLVDSTEGAREVH